MKKVDKDYDFIIKKYESYFNKVLGEKYVSVYGFDYTTNQFEVRINTDSIFFTKKDEDLYVAKSNMPNPEKILSLIGNKLSELYDELVKFSDFKTEFKHKIKSSNSNFEVDITCYRVEIYFNYFTVNDFDLSAYIYKDEYNCSCNSTAVLTAIKDKENEILKKIFVRVDDCPEWSKRTLYEMRQRQLIKQKIQEETILHKERKKQKRLELKRKFFPWSKNQSL